MADVVFERLPTPGLVLVRARAADVAILPIRLPLVHGATVTTGDIVAIWARPDGWILRAPDPPQLVETLARVLHGTVAHVIDWGDSRAEFHLAGPRAEDVLAAGSATVLSGRRFPVGHATHTKVGEVTALVHRLDEAVYRLTVERAVGPWFGAWLQEVSATVTAAAATARG
jgi:heterotetrameric sarcosine oxidase gamma subunit